jgi:hypothetical protein
MDNMLRELGGLALPPGYTYCFLVNPSHAGEFIDFFDQATGR